MGFTRTRAVAIAIAGLTAVGIPSVISGDFLGNQDTVWGYGLVFGTMFLGILAHKFGEEKMREQLINPVSDIKIGKGFDLFSGKVAPIVVGVVLIAWCVDAFGWTEDWYNPFNLSSLGTILFQWAIVFMIAFALNQKINAGIKKKYFNGEEFGDIPEEILDEQ